MGYSSFMSDSSSNITNTDSSKHFYDLTPDVILDSVEKLGVRCTGRVMALNSIENRVFEVEIEVDESKIKSPSDRFLIAKFYRPGRWSYQQIAEEHQFLTDLNHSEISVIAPLVFPNKTTLEVVPNTEMNFAVFPKLGGRMLPELSPEELERIGRLIARMHQVGESKQNISRPLLTPETYGLNNLNFLKTLPQEIFPADIVTPYENIVKSILVLIEPLFKGIKVHRIHGDCHVGNILWNTNGPVLVDFDDMVVGPPVQDLWLLLPERVEDSQRELKHLLSGYEQMRKFDRRSLILVEPLRTLRLINYSSWIARRWEDPSFKKIFPFFGTLEYWRDQINTLHEQKELIEGI